MPFADAWPNPRTGANAPERTRKDWTLPPAPGPTLRERVERREREAGLRCSDVSYGVRRRTKNPQGQRTRWMLVLSTKDRAVLAAMSMKQLAIMTKGDEETMCAQTFHSGCLISAERMTLSARGRMWCLRRMGGWWFHVLFLGMLGVCRRRSGMRAYWRLRDEMRDETRTHRTRGHAASSGWQAATQVTPIHRKV
ncbi:hypothetical protein B0H34DRAFT_434172 [Crassisporium funariophilum]|nr:hypothetical protein B0H34DRAFT_434172 [Crassisporium funariophilum]